MRMTPVPQRPVALWPLPLSVAVLFTVAAHLALWLSIRDGWIEACVPYVEGCTSISRAARRGLGNHVFRLMVLPCAALVGLHWWLAARWLGRGAAVVAWMGAAAAMALALYAAFLGTEGEAYRFLRRYGVVCFFGFGYLAQLVFLARLRAGGQGGAPVCAMLAVALLMLALTDECTTKGALVKLPGNKTDENVEALATLAPQNLLHGCGDGSGAGSCWRRGAMRRWSREAEAEGAGPWLILRSVLATVADGNGRLTARVSGRASRPTVATELGPAGEVSRAAATIAAARAALRTRAQSPAASQSFGTIHDPPMHSTLGARTHIDSPMPPGDTVAGPAARPSL